MEENDRIPESAWPLVSLVMPVYNAGHELHTTFDRIAHLTYPSLQIIVIDDGSADATGDIVVARRREDPRVQLISLPTNQGPGRARNAGLQAATGKYVWFVDWDDEWLSDILVRLVSVAEEECADVVACRGRWRSADQDGGYTDGSPDVRVCTSEQAFDLLLAGTLKGYLWTKLFRRSVLPADVFPDIRTSEDLCAVATAIARSSRVVCIPDVLYSHVKREGSLTNSANPPLENLRYARNFIHGIAGDVVSGDPEARERLLLHYDYTFWYLACVTTAARLSSTAEAVSAAGWARDRLSLSGILSIAAVSRINALKVATLMTTGTLFPRAYAVARSAQRFSRRLQRSDGRIDRERNGANG